MVDKKFKGLIDLVVDILRLHFLGDKVGDDGVDPEVQLLHSFLSVLAAALSALQALQQDFDLKQSFLSKFIVSKENLCFSTKMKSFRAKRGKLIHAYICIYIKVP